MRVRGVASLLPLREKVPRRGGRGGREACLFFVGFGCPGARQELGSGLPLSPTPLPQGERGLKPGVAASEDTAAHRFFPSPLAGEGARRGGRGGAKRACSLLASGARAHIRNATSAFPSPQPPLRAPALALAQGRSMGSEPVVRKLPLSPAGGEGLEAESWRTPQRTASSLVPSREKVPRRGGRGGARSAPFSTHQPANIFRSRSTCIRCVPATAAPCVLMSCMKTHSPVTRCGVISIIA